MANKKIGIKRFRKDFTKLWKEANKKEDTYTVTMHGNAILEVKPVLYKNTENAKPKKVYTDKKTKVVATIGPASMSVEQLKKMLKAGLNVARINFSHGDYKQFDEILKNLKQASEETGLPVATIQDLQGPKIRLGKIESEPREVKKGESAIFSTLLSSSRKQSASTSGIQKSIPLQYKDLPKVLNKGDKFVVDDGLYEFKVIKTTATEIQAEALNHSYLKSNKGINVPGVSVGNSCLTSKDKKDIQYGLKKKFDYLALSFVSGPNDICELRKILDKHKSKSKIIAKIERQSAVEQIEKIVKEVDGVMVARGDLGIEIPAEKVPIVQKEIVALCIKYSKPVIIATQILSSMADNPSATRAEISDAANAIFDQADAFMLSNETSVGKYPVRAVKTLSKVAREVESELEVKPHLLTYSPTSQDSENITDAASHNATLLAENICADILVILTRSGYTAREIAKYRTRIPIVTITNNQNTFDELQLTWGMNNVMIEKELFKPNTEHREDRVVKILKKKKLIKDHQEIVICNATSKQKYISVIRT